MENIFSSINRSTSLKRTYQTNKKGQRRKGRSLMKPQEWVAQESKTGLKPVRPFHVPPLLELQEAQNSHSTSYPSYLLLCLNLPSHLPEDFCVLLALVLACVFIMVIGTLARIASLEFFLYGNRSDVHVDGRYQPMQENTNNFYPIYSLPLFLHDMFQPLYLPNEVPTRPKETKNKNELPTRPIGLITKPRAPAITDSSSRGW